MKEKIHKLEEKANWVRKQVLEMIASAGKGHIGGAFSCTDILVALYYGGILRFNPDDKNWDGRDRFILSKGHSGAALYAILSDLGYFSPSELCNYQKKGCILGGHPDKKIPGIEADTGSLGHGLGLGAGLALSAKMDKKDFMTFVLLGDGESYEGSVWEASMFAGHHRLNNLVAITDRNGLCVTDFLKDCLEIDPLEDKWKAFGWDVVIVNGHSYEELLFALKDFRSRKSDKPLMIIAKTIKGKGVSFMESNLDYHHSVPKGEQLEIARKELNEKL
ncbi:MAG: transketolase [Candidatus Firestonebacteria bacterium]